MTAVTAENREGDKEESKCMTNYYIKVSVLNKHAGTHWLGCICRHSHDQNHKTGQMR